MYIFINMLLSCWLFCFSFEIKKKLAMFPFTLIFKVRIQSNEFHYD